MATSPCSAICLLRMQGTVTYLGVKGTHGVQEFLPNSYPLGEANPCPDLPVRICL